MKTETTTYKNSQEALLADDIAQQEAIIETTKPEQIPTSISNTMPLIPLGSSGNKNMYYSPSRGRIYELAPREHTRLPLLSMASLEEYAKWVMPTIPPEEYEKHEKPIMMQAGRLLLEATGGKLFDRDVIRERGIWLDGSYTDLANTPPTCSFIYNAGNAVYLSKGNMLNLPCEIEPNHGRHLYPANNPLPQPASEALTNETGLAFVEYLSARTWTFPHAGTLLAGWIVNALMAGALPFRSHIWINAPKNSGKTFLRDHLLGLLDSFVYQADGAVSTPAALRGALNGAALPVLADEQDSNAGDLNASLNISKKLELARLATKGGKVSMGITGGGGTRDYQLRSCFLFFSIDNALSRDADFSRWAILRMKQEAPHVVKTIIARQNEAYRKMTMDTPNNASFTSRLITRLLMEGNALLKNAHILWEKLTQNNAESRTAEMFSVLLAGIHAITVGGEMQESHLQNALNIWKEYDQQDDKSDDFSRCIETLRAAAISYKGDHLSVEVLCSKLFNTSTQNEEKRAIKEALNSAGISFTSDNDIALQSSSIYLKKLFLGTEFEKRAKSVLLDGYGRGSKVNNYGVKTSSARINGSPRRAIIIPASYIYELSDK